MGQVLALAPYMRTGLAALACLSAAGCGDYDSSLLKSSVSAARGIITRPEPPKSISPAALRAKLTPELLANEKRDLLIVTLVDNNLTALFTQTGQNGSTRTYAAPDGITLSLDNGVPTHAAFSTWTAKTNGK